MGFGRAERRRLRRRRECFSSSPVPTTASTSGMFFWISSRKRSTRHPATTSRFALPPVLWRAISRIVSIDSCWALPIKEQVLTTMTSASSASGVSSAPACASMPIMTSLSTRFLGQPRLTKPTLVGRAAAAAALIRAGGAAVTEVSLVIGTCLIGTGKCGRQALDLIDFSILRGFVPGSGLLVHGYHEGNFGYAPANVTRASLIQMK